MATNIPNSIAEINKIYDQIYGSKVSQYQNQKDTDLNALLKEDTSARNNYINSSNKIGEQKLATQNKYAGLYNDLANELSDGKAKYYGERDGAMFQNAKNVQAIRDYMAKQNLLASGESVDALLRNNTDFSNNMGSIKNNENLFIRENNSSKNKYKGEETSAYAQYDNDLASALAERDRLLADIGVKRTAVNNTYNSNISSFKDQNDANRAKAIFDYNETIRAEQEKARQEQLAREAAALEAQKQREWEAQQKALDRELSQSLAYASRSSSGSSSSSGESFYGLTTQEKNSMFNDYNSAFNSKNPLGVEEAFQWITSAYNNGQITDAEYQKYADKNKTFSLDQWDKNYTQWSANDDGSYKKKTYGYRNGVAGYY